MSIVYDDEPVRRVPLPVHPTMRRFAPKVSISPAGCWIWQGSGHSAGYGMIRHEGRAQYAHRVAYELLVGPIPVGLQIDHLCRNRRCVNPVHLEPVSQRENVLRGSGFAGTNARKTHCIHGHPLSGENLYIQPSTGGRICRTCVRDSQRRCRASRRGAST